MKKISEKEEKNMTEVLNYDKASDADVIEQMFKAGVHFGHQKSKWNPKMEPYIFAVKNGIHIIDLVKTKEKLDSALDFMEKILKSGSQVLFVGTKRQAKDFTESLSKDLKMPYVTNRWIGGTFTNFKNISKRIAKLDELEGIVQSADSKFKKQEILVFKKEAGRIEDKLGGLRNMKKIPGAMFIFDVVENKSALKEAKMMGVPVIALVDTNANPNEIDWPIPCNDDAIAVIKLIAEIIKARLIKLNTEEK
ncbi:MAG: 30S ribosomal protein S2 [bacterium]